MLKKFLHLIAGDTASAGFTLLELVVSMGIFLVLVVAAIGIMLGVSQAQLKAANIQAIQDNIRFSLELITKEMRTGSGYALTGYGNSCGGVSGSEISFTTSLGQTRVYYLDEDTGAVMRIAGSTLCANAVPFTAEEVIVDRLSFLLRGEAPGPDDGQPMITISLKVRSQSPKYALESSMDLQTAVVQRFRDF